MPPLNIFPFRMMPPPSPVPSVKSTAVRHPVNAPLYSSASAAPFASFAISTGTFGKCASISFLNGTSWKPRL